MYTYRRLAAFLLVSILGCAPAADQNPSATSSQSAERSTDQIYLEIFALEDFQKRLDEATLHSESGNAAQYRAVRDSLLNDVNAYIRENPLCARDPEFTRILSRLAELDTLQLENEVEYSRSFEDSVALSLADWPDLSAQPEGGKLFSKTKTVFPEIDNSRIDFWIDYYTGPGRERFDRAIYRMQLHRPVVERILAEMGLPRELICVALIESGFTMNAVSRAQAVGPWQFIRGTGKRYGLRIDWWYDERQDIVASTYAAGNYLKDLYAIWDDWFLALAAYNCGEYRVARAVARYRTEDFWHLQLPKQTQRYVPKFLAALYLLRDPEQYGIRIPDAQPIEFDVVTITEATDLSVIAQCANTNVQDIRELNPACLRQTTPPGMEIAIKVPRGTADACVANLSRIPAEERATWRRHQVRRGETLSMIANANGTSVGELKKLNGIRDAHHIREGQVLLVPLKGDYPEVASSKPGYKTSNGKIDRESLEKYAQRSESPRGYRKVVYTVRPKDTLGEIAERHKTSASKLRAWNDINRRSFIHPGQRLAIYVPDSFEAPAETTERTPDETNYVRRDHVVRKGESFYSISRTYEIGLDELLAWNNKTRQSALRPGDVLQVWTRK